jgi:hypothetical protein
VTGGALAAPLRRNSLVAAGSALAGALVLLAVVGAVHLFGGGTGSSDPARPFSIAAPAGWSIVRGPSGAVLRRADGRGTVIVRRIPPVSGDLRVVARDLTAQLRARVPGFKLVSARIGRVRAGGAFLYTFVRGNGAAQSLTLTKVGGATYRIDTVVPAGAPDAAREAGAAVASFGP